MAELYATPKHKQSKLTKKEAKNITQTEYNLSLMVGKNKRKKTKADTKREKKDP